MPETTFALTIPVDCETIVLAEGRRYAAHPLVMSHQVYEVQRGVPRLLAMLAGLDVRATFFVPGFTLERHPQLVEPILTAGHEIAHHSYAHRRPTDMTADEERADFERALAALDRFGIAPAGHRAASWAPSWQTLELVAEHGLAYDCSLMGDDAAYRVRAGGREVVELPVHWGLDDFDHYAFLPDPHLGRNVEAPQTAVRVWRAELDGMRAGGGGLFQLTCHAFLSGRPGRVAALRGLLEHALGCPDVVLRTCRDAAARAAADPAVPVREHAPPATRAPAPAAP